MVALCVCTAVDSLAGSLAISPVRLTLAAGRTAGVVTVLNNDAQPTLVQVEVMRWSQSGSADRLETTREMLATPPVFTLPAGATQLVRVGMRGPMPAGTQEVSYRLLLKEVPPARESANQGVQIALNISMPVFVMPAMPAGSVPSLRWQARRADGALWLRADNDGPVHVQVTGVRLNGGEPLAQFSAGYVLPGAYHEWKLSQEIAPGGALSVVAQTDAGEFVAQVVVSAP